MDAILFHNPNAGMGDHSAEMLCRMLARAHFDVRYCSTKGPDFKKMLKEKADLAIVAGGDGTVRNVVTKLAGGEVPIAILPLGTANNIATSLGISGPAEKHAATWRTGRRQRFDIGVAAGSWGRRQFVEAMGCGVFAEAIGTKVDEDAPRQERIRLGRKSLRKILEKAVPLDVDVEIDGESVNGVMTGAPLAMVGCGFSPDDAALGISWHVMAMFGPSFFTGALISRFGKETIVATGLVLLIACAVVALSGIQLWQFWAALILLGLGWNFAFIGATTMVAGSYRNSEKGKVQGVHDFILFGSVAFGSLMSGAVYNSYGWEMLNWIVFPVTAVCLAALVALFFTRSRAGRVVRNER